MYFALNAVSSMVFFKLYKYSSKCGKIRTRITPNTDTLHAVFGYSLNVRTDVAHQIQVILQLFKKDDYIFDTNPNPCKMIVFVTLVQRKAHELYFFYQKCIFLLSPKFIVYIC